MKKNLGGYRVVVGCLSFSSTTRRFAVEEQSLVARYVRRDGRDPVMEKTSCTGKDAKS